MEAKFLLSAADKRGFYRSEKPMIAVCGKSNVGKSSFINALANRKKLAKTSAEPGRTRLVNYFDLGGFVLADLPGYGYARVSKAEKAKWARLLEDFFCEPIAHVFALADIRHDPTADDLTMIEYLTYRRLPFTIVATKADKLSKMRAAMMVRAIAAKFKTGEGNILPFSSVTGQGRAEVFALLEGVAARAAAGEIVSEE